MPKSLRLFAVLLALAAATACGGGGGGDGGGTDDGGGANAPSNLVYLLAQGLYRVNEAIAANTATVDGDVDSFSVAPPLPAGLSFNTTTGAITGTPTAESSQTHTVTATNTDGSTDAQVEIKVGPELPAVVESLELGFICEVLSEGLSIVTKLALPPAPDDRIFFTEVGGRLCVRAANGTVSVIATEAVTTGGHHGLIGLALDPDFASNAWIYLQFTEDSAGTVAPFQRIVRWTDGTPATNRSIVVPNMPASPPMDINNGGELRFDQLGLLLVSVGDVNVPANAQAPPVTSRAGKLLRFNPANPGDFSANPNGDPEYCRGLRNTFGIAVHPNGDVFACDNGPDSNDELNVVNPGDNFGWGDEMAANGFKIKNYPTVIVPTGLEWHDGTGWGAEFDDDLFMTSYDEHTIRRFEILFAPGLAIDNETVFAQFVDNAGQNHPLDIAIHRTTGDLYVATFSGIYRFSKQ